MSILTTLKKSVPSILTCSSAFCGMLATFLALEGETSLVLASYLILLAAVFDFSDGFAARLLNACSEMGKELDSLADTISFGVAPSAILYQFLRQRMELKGQLITFEGWQIAVLACSIMVAIFAILRLAKFNVDPEQSTSFKGLASPSCAIAIASLPAAAEIAPDIIPITYILKLFSKDLAYNCEFVIFGFQLFVLYKWYVILGLGMFFAIMMITDLPMFSLKLKNFSYAKYHTVVNFLIFAFLMVALFFWLAVPLVILVYIMISLIKWLRRDKAKA